MTMNAAEKIYPQAWMKIPATRKVMDALGKGDALFVGGCVRNALLGHEVSDIDIATKHKPDAVIDILTKADIKVIPTGIEHGTVTAILDGQAFEITTLRKDVETDGRRAVVAFSECWEEDAQRRDFTMNTLLMNVDGEVFDPTGQGVDDLRAGRVVFVGDAETRIAEDVLRILRFFRFHGTYGKGELDEVALKACKAAADKIPELSKERITQEFFKILSIDNPVSILGLMRNNNILPTAIPAQAGISSIDKKIPDQVRDDTVLKTLGHLCDFQMRYGLHSSPSPLAGEGRGGGGFHDPSFLSVRLLVLADFSPAKITEFENLLLIPKVFKKDIQAIDKILQLPDLKDDHAVKVAVYKYGRVPTAQALMIELATDRVINGYAPKALEIIQNWDIPDFPVSGEDLMKEGIPQGPELGQELEKREQAWIDDGFITSF